MSKRNPVFRKLRGFRGRLYGLVGLALVALSVMAGVHFWGARSVELVAQDANRHIRAAEQMRHLQSGLRQLGLLENRFLLDRSEDLVDRYEATMELLRIDIADLHPLIADARLSGQLDDLEARLREVEVDFAQVVAQERLLGFTDGEGLRSTLLAKVLRLEEELKQHHGMDTLRLKVMEMRGFEKDFLIYGEPAYLGRVRKAANEFDFFIYGTAVGVEDRDRMLAILKEYLVALDAYAQAAGSSAQATKMLHAHFDAIIPSVRAMLDSVQEAAAQAEQARQTSEENTGRVILVVLVVLLLLVPVAGILLGRSVAGPLIRLVRTMRAMSAGDMEVSIPETGRRDEMGEIARALEVFKQAAEERRRLEAREADVRRRQLERADNLERLTKGFGSRVDGLITQVMDNVERFRSDSETMLENSRRTSAESDQMGQVVRQAVQSVEAVATASTQLACSSREINHQMDGATRVTDQAVAEMQFATGRVERLQEAVRRVDDVVKLIDDISAQTTLLSLNATIEAARAGRHGKGFAVVANEVKQLSAQTGAATQEVVGHLSMIRNETQAAVDAIGKIGKSIARISGVSGSVAAAVREQESATREISQSVERTAAGTDRITQAIGAVSDMSRFSYQAAENVSRAANDLQRESDVLKTQVGDFLGQVRTL